MATHEDPYPFVYRDNFRVNIKSHNPPPPFGHPSYKANLPSISPPDPTRTETQLDYVFLHPPIQTNPVEHPQESVLTIIRQLTDRKSDGARVFVARVDPKIKGLKADVVFAKIYDPLYYSYAFLGVESVRNPVVDAADSDYSREAAAYEFLCDKGHDGASAPAYYGSWTLTAPPYQGRTRPVRLIITEYIPAPSLYQEHYRTYVPYTFPKKWIPPNEQPNLPDKLRLQILALALELRAQQLHLGLNQRDFAPRNIIVLWAGRMADEPAKHLIQRVVLVDYNNSIVYPRSNRKFSQTRWPTSPLEVCWDHGIPGFDEWEPKTWHGNPDRRRQWLYTTFGSCQRYEPLSQRIKAKLEVFLKTNKMIHAP